MNVRLRAWTLAGSPRGPTLQEVGLRAGRRRAAPAGLCSLVAAGSPRPNPSESEAGGGREAHARRGGAGRRPRGWWAAPALPRLVAQGLGAAGTWGPSRNDPAV